MFNNEISKPEAPKTEPMPDEKEGSPFQIPETDEEERRRKNSEEEEWRNPE